MVLKKTVAAMFSLFLVGATIASTQEADDVPFDLNEAIAMEAFLRGVAYQCLSGKTLGDFVNSSKRQVAFAAQEMRLDRSLYVQLESDIEAKASADVFKQLTTGRCLDYEEVLVRFDESRNQTLDALEDILNDLGSN